MPEPAAPSENVFTTEPAADDPQTVGWVHHILSAERGITVAATPLEASGFEAGGIRFGYVFYDCGLVVNVMYTLEAGGKRAVGFKLSEGMPIPAELADTFKFARQKSKLAGEIRGSFFVVKGEYV